MTAGQNRIAIIAAAALCGIAVCAAARTRETRSVPHFVTFIVTHLGDEDRPMPALLLFDSDARAEVTRRYDCSHDRDCVAVSHADFTTLAEQMDTEFRAQSNDDKDVEPLGSFAFTLGDRNGAVWEIRRNKAHSAELLSHAAKLLPKGDARDAVERRLAVTHVPG